MKDHEFAQLLGGIDPELIARAEAPATLRKTRGFRIALVSIAAALLVLLALAGAAAIASLPKIYPLDYESPQHLFANKTVQIYYTKDGEIKSQNVLLPPSAENIYMTWQHLNGLGEEFALIQTATSEDADQGQMTLTLSSALRDHPESDALLASLQKTFALFYGMQAQSLSFVFADQETPEEVVLEFSHDLARVPLSVRNGKTLNITVTMTNVSDHDIVHVGSWSDFVPSAKLCSGDSVLSPIPHFSTEEIAEYRLAPGQSKSITYTFEIPYALPIYSDTHYSIVAAFYNLVLSYDQYSYTVKQAVLVGFDSANNRPAVKAFYEFSQKHVPNTRNEFTQALDSCTYQGENIMEKMQILCGDGIDRSWTEWGETEYFAYSASGKSCDWVNMNDSAFSAQVLPDGWALPMGITEQDSISEALLKMGYSQEVIDKFLSEHGTIRLAGNSVLSSTIYFDGSLYLHCDKNSYVIEHTVTTLPEYSESRMQHAIQTVRVYYNRDDMRFEKIRIELRVTTQEAMTLPRPVIMTQIAEQAQQTMLTEDQIEILQKAMFNGNWSDGCTEIVCDYEGKFGEKDFKYSSEKGILQYDGFEVKLQGSDWEQINLILGCESPFSSMLD